MRKLVLYSSMDPNINPENMQKIKKHLLKMIKSDNPRIGYIASETDRGRKYFNKTRRYYEALGIDNLEYIDLDEEYNEAQVENLLNYDAIYLSTGNTFTFLSLLKKRKMLSKLEEYSKKGGVLIGASAGSIIMGPDIGIAKFADKNEVGIEKLASLGLVDFTVKPHWDIWENRIDDFKDYSMKNNKKIYMIREGEAIVVEDKQITIYGQGVFIEKGQVYKINLE